VDSNEEQKTLDSIFDSIIQDIEEELESVKSVLLFYNYSYFLEVKRETLDVELDARFKSDIKSVLNYYFLMENPSSSALSRLLLESLKGIVDSNPRDLQQEVEGFLQEVEQNVLRARSCHVGLRRLTNEIHDKIDENITPEILRNWAQEELEKLSERRKKLRTNAANYLARQLSSDIPHFNILLYGYSELAIKALCGFRSATKKKLNELNDGESISSTEEEKRASECFTIFICEGQPKNHTTWGGRVAYHDGARYAQSLSRRGFANIHIIPDAVAGTLLLHLGGETPPVDYIIIGANGFDENTFVHSAGHAMIAGLKNLAAEIGAKKPGGSAPKLVLATLTDKFSMVDPTENNQADAPTQDTTRDGWAFKGSFGNERVRLQPFFAQDERLHDTLLACKPPISFYNPREDRIPIQSVDVAITEVGWFVQKKHTKEPWNGSLFASMSAKVPTAE
jgi:translation initiation factor 2B subunit (eIF-2B alpha/beta/delta family)